LPISFDAVDDGGDEIADVDGQQGGHDVLTDDRVVELESV
jgi:hypothetical protein